MKQSFKSIFPIIIGVFSLLLSCCSGKKSDSIHLENAGYLINTLPDSSFQELEKIRNPENLTTAQIADYGRLKIQSELLTGNELVSYVLADSSITYYESILNTDALLIVLYYAGIQNRMINESKKAISYLQRADTIARLCSNDSILSKIWRQMGYVYQDMERRDKAVECHQTALDFSLHFNDGNSWSYYWSLGSAYQNNKEYSRALWAFEKTLEVADTSVVADISPQIYTQLALVSKELHDYPSSFQHLSTINQSQAHKEKAPIYYLTKGQLFMEIQQYDSARYFFNRAKNQSNLFISIMAYTKLMDLDKTLEQYESAISNGVNASNQFSTLMENTTLKEMQKQYLDEKLKNENTLLRLAKRDREVYLLITCIALAGIFVLVFVYYTFNKRKKAYLLYQVQEQTLKDKALLLENQNLILQQTQEMSALREKAAVLRASVFRKMSIAEKIPSLDSEKITNPMENKRISLSEHDWNELLRTIREAYPEFMNHLKEYYPELTKEDICFCCLVKIHVNMQDLSDIYCISRRGISKKKQRMKKEKLGILDENTTLDDFLQNF